MVYQKPLFKVQDQRCKSALADTRIIYLRFIGLVYEHLGLRA